MKVLISAYACEPDKGSEPGAGWNWSRAAARDHEVWVLTRANNRAAIEAELERRPHPSLHFVYVDLPRWASWWKRGQRGVRLYYSLWQVAALREARRLHAEVSFDVVHHVTFANAWLPAGVAFVDAPFVLGPVDAGLSVPLRFYRELGLRGVLAEWKAESVRAISRVNPIVRRGIGRARLILAQNDESAAKLGGFGLPVIVRPHASVDPEPLMTARQEAGPRRKRSAIVAGRLVAWKGVSLAIRAMALVPDWSLSVIGAGPDEKRLRHLTDQLDVSERVEFVGWLNRHDLWRRISQSSVVVVPSIRDAAPLIVSEAATLGVPVIALDQGGPRAIARLAGGCVQLVHDRSRLGTAEAIGSALIASVRADRRCTNAFAVDVLADVVTTFYRSIEEPPDEPANAPDCD